MGPVLTGIPLTDEDRWPWLNAVAAWIDATRKAGSHGVIACSALKRAYRDILIGERPDVRLVYLKGDRDLIARLRRPAVRRLRCRASRPAWLVADSLLVAFAYFNALFGLRPATVRLLRAQLCYLPSQSKHDCGNPTLSITFRVT
jgi:hypothetical protein